MATFYGTNAQSLIDGNKVPPGESNGHTKNMSDKHTFSQNVIAVGDIVELGSKIPKGAKVKGVHCICPSLGTTGIFTLGYKATDAEAEAATALTGAQDAGGQAVASYTPVLADKLSEEKQVIAKFTEATTAANGLAVKVNVEYVVD